MGYAGIASSELPGICEIACWQAWMHGKKRGKETRDMCVEEVSEKGRCNTCGNGVEGR